LFDKKLSLCYIFQTHTIKLCSFSYDKEDEMNLEGLACLIKGLKMKIIIGLMIFTGIYSLRVVGPIKVMSFVGGSIFIGSLAAFAVSYGGWPWVEEAKGTIISLFIVLFSLGVMVIWLTTTLAGGRDHLNSEMLLGFTLGILVGIPVAAITEPRRDLS